MPVTVNGATQEVLNDNTVWKKNIRKHGLFFEAASIAFADPSVVVIIFIRIPKTDII